MFQLFQVLIVIPIALVLTNTSRFAVLQPETETKSWHLRIHAKTSEIICKLWN